MCPVSKCILLANNHTGKFLDKKGTRIHTCKSCVSLTEQEIKKFFTDCNLIIQVYFLPDETISVQTSVDLLSLKAMFSIPVLFRSWFVLLKFTPTYLGLLPNVIVVFLIQAGKKTTSAMKNNNHGFLFTDTSQLYDRNSGLLDHHSLTHAKLTSKISGLLGISVGQEHMT